MKIIRIIFGVVASLFVLMHLIEMPRFLSTFERIPDHLHASRWIGKGTAIFVGAGIAFACFKVKKKQPANQASEPTPLEPGD